MASDDGAVPVRKLENSPSYSAPFVYELVVTANHVERARSLDLVLPTTVGMTDGRRLMHDILIVVNYLHQGGYVFIGMLVS